MSEEMLRRFVERVNADTSFRESVASDPGRAFAEFQLSPTERMALVSGDEDALRRLAGADVAPFVQWSILPICRVFPTVHGTGCPTVPVFCTEDCTMLCPQQNA